MENAKIYWLLSMCQKPSLIIDILSDFIFTTFIHSFFKIIHYWGPIMGQYVGCWEYRNEPDILGAFPHETFNVAIC